MSPAKSCKKQVEDCSTGPFSDAPVVYFVIGFLLHSNSTDRHGEKCDNYGAPSEHAKNVLLNHSIYDSEVYMHCIKNVKHSS